MTRQTGNQSAKRNGVCNIKRNGVAVGEGGNYPSTTAPARPSNCPPITFDIFDFGFWFALLPCCCLLALGLRHLCHLPCNHLFG
jgi:hypothetical protein